MRVIFLISAALCDVFYGCNRVRVGLGGGGGRPWVCWAVVRGCPDPPPAVMRGQGRRLRFVRNKGVCNL